MQKNTSLQLFPIAIALFVIIFSVNQSSLWIDEMITYQIINKGSFSEMFSNVWNAHNANGGMPLYFILEWGWTQLFGYSEIGMRSLNIPFAIIYLASAWFITRKTEAPSWVSALFLFHPVFLFYMNDARPYILLLSMGSVFTYLLFYGNLNKTKTLLALHFTFLMGLMSHMMFAFIILLYFVHSISLIKEKKFDIKKNLTIFGAFAIPYLAILGYYMYLMTGADELGGVSELAPNWKASIIQIIYYFTGFGGLGLSRNGLRSMDFSQLSVTHLAGIALMALGYLTLVVYFIKNKLWKDKQIQNISLAVLLTFAIFCIANIILKTRFWERHIIYLLPATILLLSCILKSMFTSSKILYKAGAIAIICLMMVSGIRTIFDEYYGKEDYKGVANYVKETKNTAFFLQGDSLIYRYYGIDFEKNTQIRMINHLQKEELGDLKTEDAVPSFLVLSGRNDFDSGELYKTYATQPDEKIYNSFRIVKYKGIE